MDIAKALMICWVISLAILTIGYLAQAALAVGIDGTLLATCVGSICLIAGGYGGFKVREFLR